MDPKNIDLDKLHEILYKFKFSLSQIKPVTYIGLKPYIKDKIDIQVTALNERAKFTYEAILSDEVLIFIAQQTDFKISYKIYNSIIIDSYKNKLYRNLPKNHPLKISKRIYNYILLFSLTTIFILLVANNLPTKFKFISQSSIAVLGILLLPVVAKKIYLFKCFSSI